MLIRDSTIVIFSGPKLRIYQGRILNTGSNVQLETFEVKGVATVEINAANHLMPTYFFDCTTTLNNSNALTWTYQGGDNRFEVESIPTREQEGVRMDVGTISANDLGVYTCLDTSTNTSNSITITQGRFSESQ